MHKFVFPTIQYYDWNRNQKGITAMQYLPKATACPTGLEALRLYTWPGTVQGYHTGGKFHRGTSETGTQLPAKKPVTVQEWRSGHFCAKRQDPKNFNYLTTDGAQCGSGHTACSECECVNQATAVNNCPYSQFQLTNGAGSSGWADCSTDAPAAANVNHVTVGGVTTTQQCKWGEASNENRSYLIYLTVEMFGVPCMNEEEHPAGQSAPWQAVINEVRGDCGTLFGPDQEYSLKADEMTVKAFVADNNDLSAATMGQEVYNAYQANTELAKLYGRYQIETKCSADCRNFRMTPAATRLRVEMAEAYEDLDMICLISGIGGVLCLFAVLLVAFQQRRAKQSWYLLSMALCLMTTFVVLILVGMFIHTLSYRYWAARNAMKTHAQCVRDANWRKLPMELYNKTSMDSELWWAKFFCFFLVMLLLGGFGVTHYVFSQLGKLPNNMHHQM